MKKLFVLLTILMLVTVHSYAGGTTPCNKNANEVRVRNTKATKCSSFGKLKMNKQDRNRYHNYKG